MENQVSRIKRNSIFSFFSIAARLIANIILFIGIARWYGPEVLGSFSSAFAMSAIFIVLGDFGFDILLTTEVAKKQRDINYLIMHYFSIKFTFSMVAMIILWTLPLIREINPTTISLTYILSFSVIFTTLSNFFFALFKGLEQFEHEMKIVLLSNIMLIVFLTIIALAKLSVLLVGVAFVLSRAITLALASFKTVQLIDLKKFHFTLHGLSTEWRIILIFGFSVISGNLLVLVVTPLLLFLQNEYAVGIYESVFKIVGLTLIIPEIGINTMLPTLSRFNEENKDKWLRASMILNKTLFFLSLPISLCLFVIPEHIIALLYGLDKYSASVPIMRIAAFVVIVRFLVETAALMLTTSNRQSIRMIITAAGTVCMAILCLILIPRYGVMGAAISSLIVNVLIGGGYVLAVRPHYFEWIFKKDFIIPSIATALSGWCLLYFDGYIKILMILPIMVFNIFLYYFIGYSKSERKMLFSIQG